MCPFSAGKMPARALSHTVGLRWIIAARPRLLPALLFADLLQMATSYIPPARGPNEPLREEPREEGFQFPAVHPFLFAVFPVFALFAASSQRVELADVSWPLTLAFGGAFVISVLLALIVPGRDRAALGATWTILCFWSYGPASQLAALPRSLHLAAIPQSLLLPIVLAIWLAGIWFLRRHQDEKELKEENNRLSQFATFSGSAGVVAMLGLILWHRPDLQPSFEPSAYAHSNPAANQIDPALPVAGAKSQPDIYYLVVHRYAGAKQLEKQFDLENQSFEASLKKAGFVIPAESWATEADARRGLAAALDLQHPSDRFAGDLALRRQLASSQTIRLLKARGYRYYHLGSPPDGLRDHPLADWSYRFSPCSNEFAESLLRLTPPGVWFSPLSFHDREIGKFDRLSVIPREASPGPKFVLAHFNVPGDTWRLDSAGTEISSAEVAQRGDKQNYVNQLLFTNQRLGQAVNAILRQSKRPPIIVVQSVTTPLALESGDIAKVTTARQPAFAAIWLPEPAKRAKIPASLSPGNTFRFLFREYFGAEVNLLSEPPPELGSTISL